MKLSNIILNNLRESVQPIKESSYTNVYDYVKANGGDMDVPDGTIDGVVCVVIPDDQDSWYDKAVVSAYKRVPMLDDGCADWYKFVKRYYNSFFKDEFYGSPEDIIEDDTLNNMFAGGCGEEYYKRMEIALTGTSIDDEVEDFKESVSSDEEQNVRYEVWQKYYDEDGSPATPEYVTTLPSYEKAAKYAEGLMRDSNCEAWVKEKKLKESEDVKRDLAIEPSSDEEQALDDLYNGKKLDWTELSGSDQTAVEHFLATYGKDFTGKSWNDVESEIRNACHEIGYANEELIDNGYWIDGDTDPEPNEKNVSDYIFQNYFLPKEKSKKIDESEEYCIDCSDREVDWSLEIDPSYNIKKEVKDGIVRYSGDKESLTKFANDQLPNYVHTVKKVENINESTSFDSIVLDSYNHLTNDLGKNPTIDDIIDDILNNYDQDYINDNTPEDSLQASKDVKYVLMNNNLDFKDLNESANNDVNIIEENENYKLVKVKLLSDGSMSQECIEYIDNEGNSLGTVSYTIYENGEYHIYTIEVRDDQRRKGIATILMKALQKEVGDNDIYFDTLTPSGKALLDKIANYDVYEKGKLGANKYKGRIKESQVDDNIVDVTGKEPSGVYTVSNNMVIYVYEIAYDINDRVLVGDSLDETKAKWTDIIYDDNGEAYFLYGDIRVDINEVMRTNF